VGHGLTAFRDKANNWKNYALYCAKEAFVKNRNREERWISFTSMPRLPPGVRVN